MPDIFSNRAPSAGITIRKPYSVIHRFLDLPVELEILIWSMANDNCRNKLQYHLPACPFIYSIGAVLRGATIIGPGACFQRLHVIQGAGTMEIYQRVSNVLRVERFSRLLTLRGSEGSHGKLNLTFGDINSSTGALKGTKVHVSGVIQWGDRVVD